MASSSPRRLTTFIIIICLNEAAPRWRQRLPRRQTTYDDTLTKVQDGVIVSTATYSPGEASPRWRHRLNGNKQSRWAGPRSVFISMTTSNPFLAHYFKFKKTSYVKAHSSNMRPVSISNLHHPTDRGRQIQDGGFPSPAMSNPQQNCCTLL